jgi:hypothetical protein
MNCLQIISWECVRARPVMGPLQAFGPSVVVLFLGCVVSRASAVA